MKIFLTFLAIAVAVGAFSQDKLSVILKNELNRNMEGLKKEANPPYYISYRVNDITSFRVTASFGKITSSYTEHNRYLCVSVRVGDYALDNMHPIKGEDYGWFDWDRGSFIPVDDTEDGISQVLWKETDKQYKKSSDLYQKVLTNVALKVEDEDKSEDFSKEKTSVYHDIAPDDATLSIDLKEWEEKLEKITAVFLTNNDVLQGTAFFYYSVERKYFVDSEGNDISENWISCRMLVEGQTMADDGMELPLHNSYFGLQPSDLPPVDVIIQDTKKLCDIISRLKTAPVVDSYTGPALLAAASAGVFFHEIFGHRIEGQRMKDESDAQTFKKKVGEKVLNEDLSIVFDPTITSYGEFFLNGAYKYDDQGQEGKKTVIVEDGILKNFLMSRTPITGFPNSNGHGRAQAGFQPVSRQSNLIVTTRKPYSIDDLRKMLIKEAKKQGKEYGYFFVSTIGGFTNTGRYSPNSFNVTPTEVYRIYVDGRPDELVRGVDLIGTPLSIFSNILAAGNDPGIFTGMCGAESGSVPTTTVCPTLFVKQIETQRKPKNQNKPPILPRP